MYSRCRNFLPLISIMFDPFVSFGERHCSLESGNVWTDINKMEIFGAFHVIWDSRRRSPLGQMFLSFFLFLSMPFFPLFFHMCSCLIDHIRPRPTHEFYQPHYYISPRKFTKRRWAMDQIWFTRLPCIESMLSRAVRGGTSLTQMPKGN